MMSFLFCFFPNHSLKTGNGDDLLLEAPVTHVTFWVNVKI